MHAHNVYFSLKDNSKPKIEELLNDCRNYLANLDGIKSFACGTRESELNRPVNDTDFDVSLHIIFQDKDSHDRYQTAEAHEEFIRQNGSNWAAVRVFDSSVG